jgi:Predicted membrane protein
MNSTFFDLSAPVVVIVNVFVCLLYGFDKWQARREGWRVSEGTLLFSAFFAPFGAVSGMILFRHKIRKAKFFIAVPFFVVLQGILIFIILP